MKKQAVLSLSGGMDSSSLLLHLLANGYEVTALGFDYGQKHKVELERAKSLVDYINSYCVVDDNPKTAEYPYFVKHQMTNYTFLLHQKVCILLANWMGYGNFLHQILKKIFLF